jgi:hypothetical protein
MIDGQRAKVAELQEKLDDTAHRLVEAIELLREPITPFRVSETCDCPDCEWGRKVRAWLAKSEKKEG